MRLRQFFTFVLEILAIAQNIHYQFPDNGAYDKKSIPFSGGTISWRKQPPKFFFNDTEVSPDNYAFLDFTKKFYADFIKTKEFVDWANFKTKLKIVDDSVYFVDTGEVIDGLKALILPDKFSVKIND